MPPHPQPRRQEARGALPRLVRRRRVVLRPVALGEPVLRLGVAVELDVGARLPQGLLLLADTRLRLPRVADRVVAEHVGSEAAVVLRPRPVVERQGRHLRTLPRDLERPRRAHREPDRADRVARARLVVQQGLERPERERAADARLVEGLDALLRLVDGRHHLPRAEEVGRERDVAEGREPLALLAHDVVQAPPGVVDQHAGPTVGRCGAPRAPVDVRGNPVTEHTFGC